MMPDIPESLGSVFCGSGLLLAICRGPESKLQKKFGNVPAGKKGEFRITILITYLENAVGANMLIRAPESCPWL